MDILGAQSPFRKVKIMTCYLVIADESQDAGEKVMEIFEFDGTNGKAAQILLKWCEGQVEIGLFDEDFKFPQSFEGLAELLWDDFGFSVQQV